LTLASIEVHERNELVLIAHPLREAVRHDDMGFCIDGGLRVVALDVAVHASGLQGHETDHVVIPVPFAVRRQRRMIQDVNDHGIGTPDLHGIGGLTHN
jgi:hypothetical protein